MGRTVSVEGCSSYLCPAVPAVVLSEPYTLLCCCLQVVAAVRALSEGHAWAVRGNNDDGALAAYYEVQQGLTPKKKKHRWVGQLLPEDVQFLQQLPFSLRVEG